MKRPSLITQGMMCAASMLTIAYADNHSFNSWTGSYIGANAGLVFNHVQLKSQHLGFTNPDETCNAHADFSSVFPGIQWGYLYQFPNTLVSGIEVNATYNTHQQKTLFCTCPYNPNVFDRFSFKNKMQGSIKGRAGRALQWNKTIFLPYFTAGASFADLGLKYKNEGGDYYSAHTTRAAWLIGAGIEYLLKENWSLRLDYSYVDYGNSITLKIPSVYGLIDPNGNAHTNLNANTVLLALNYWL